MDGENIGQNVVENQRLFASDRVPRKQADHPVAVRKPRQIGSQVLEARVVGWQISELMQLN